jgi:hypothetical protein
LTRVKIYGERHALLIDCPTCHARVPLHPKADKAEQQHNDLLLGFQDAVLRYKCFFEPEGCGKTFLKDDLLAHMETCEFRKFVCRHENCDKTFFLHEVENHTHY